MGLTNGSKEFSSTAQRWRAVAARDKQAADAFIYAVRTTGIYCRPGCSSRLPRPENVVYFDTAPHAETAGFRACKRCAPQLSSAPNPDEERITKACRIMEEAQAQAQVPPTLTALARGVGLSREHFQRLFKKHLGVTPKEYAMELRHRRLEAGLQQGASVTRAIYEAGFGATSRFYEGGADRLGMAPARYGKGGEGEAIQYAVGPCVLGLVLVAATERGVCAINLGNTGRGLVDALRTRFPKADIREGGLALTAWLEQVVGLMDSPGRELNLPLDIQGTAFQQRVWKALRDIPAGATLSYTQLAEQVGRPKAVRAVAGACAANRLAVVVPCHRVLRSDGSVSGYYWGVERKRALLAQEASAK